MEGLNPSDFRGSIGSAGPYDFLPLKTDRLKAIFGSENQRWKSQPIEFVNGHNQPMLLLVGLKDDVVLSKNTFNLAKKLKLLIRSDEVSTSVRPELVEGVASINISTSSMRTDFKYHRAEAIIVV